MRPDRVQWWRVVARPFIGDRDKQLPLLRHQYGSQETRRHSDAQIDGRLLVIHYNLRRGRRDTVQCATVPAQTAPADAVLFVRRVRHASLGEALRPAEISPHLRDCFFDYPEEPG